MGCEEASPSADMVQSEHQDKAGGLLYLDIVALHCRTSLGSQTRRKLLLLMLGRHGFQTLISQRVALGSILKFLSVAFSLALDLEST